MAAGHFGVFRASEMDAIWRWRAELGVPEHASPEEIKRAYWRAVKQVHPDLHPNDATAAARFRGLHEAYEALTAIANRSSAGRLTDAWEGQF